MEPIINSQLPEFKVQAFQNGSFKTVSHEDVKGKWAIFFFYPADFTFVCPTELVDIAEKYDQFQAMGVEVYSVSTDSHFVHKAWHDASESIRKIKYPMLADPTGVLSRAFGVMIEEEGMAYRGTFLVNPEGKNQDCRDTGQQHRTQCRRAAAQGRSCTVCCHTRWRSLPCQVEERSGNFEAEHRPCRKDLISNRRSGRFHHRKTSAFL